jgi:hypothetical protein
MKEVIEKLRLKVKEAAVGGGWTARHMMLAYALTRGVPYRVLELKTREDNKPSVTTLVESTGKAEEAVQAWLAAPASPEVQAQAIRAREARIAAKRAYAEAHRPTGTA